MSLSFEETAKALARHRNISMDEAETLLAGRHDLLDPAATLSSEEGLAFDDPDVFESSLIRAPEPMRRGRVVAMDDDLSPRMAVQRQENVDAARAEGDRYRQMSRATSLHTNGENG